MKYIPASFLLIILSVAPTVAQIQPSEQETKVVAAITELLFDQLPKNAFAEEYRYLTPGFAASAPLADWERARNEFLELAGSTPRYVAHQVTFYQQESLLAAVDFSGKAAKPDTYVCSFVLWDFYAPEKIGLLRLEQNVVSVEVFNTIPKQQAAQLMADFHCPVSLIETVLQVSLQ